MKKNINKKEFFSIKEIEKEFLPKAYEKELEVEQKDAYKLGISLANKSIEKIRNNFL